MKARTRTAVTTLVLLAAAAGALAVAWFGVRLNVKEEAAREAGAKKLFDLDPTMAREIRVQAKGSEVKLVRAGEGWKIAAPVEADADPEAVRRLLDQLASLERRATSAAPGAAPATLAAYGLAQPRARVEVALEGGRVERLALGDDSGFDGAMFVMPTGGAVDVVASEARGALDQGLQELRDRRVLRLEDEKDVVKVRVKTPRLSYALAREGEGWKLVEPIADRADDAAANRIASALRSLRATEIVDARKDAKEYGLDRPRLEITVTSKDGPARRLAVGSAPGSAQGAASWVRAEGAPGVASVPASALAAFEVDLVALRDKRILRFERERVAAVRIETEGGPIEVKKNASAPGGVESWRLIAPKDAPARGWRVSALLSTLSTLDGIAFFDETGRKEAEAGLKKPRETVTLLDASGKEIARLEAGAERGPSAGSGQARVLVRGSGSPRIYEVEKARLEGVPRTLSDLEESPASPADAGPP